MVVCFLCRQGTFIPRYNETERIHYSYCSFCKAEVADTKEVQLNNINRLILLLKNNKTYG